MKLFITLISSAIAVAVASYIVPGVVVASFATAILVAIVLGVINAVIRPVVTFLTLPVNLLTLGLFTFVINALMVMLASAVVSGFTVDGFLAALLFSIVVSLVSAIVDSLVNKESGE